jgi:hypothetical protein
MLGRMALRAGSTALGASELRSAYEQAWIEQARLPVDQGRPGGPVQYGKGESAATLRALPVEFTRKGRFSELYGVYLPTPAERLEIFGIHLRLRGREPKKFDLERLALQAEAYTGADIKEVVQMGLKLAFHAGVQLTNDHLLAAIPEIRPLSKTDPEAIPAMPHWLDSHTKPAGTGQTTNTPVNGQPRKRRVTV